MLLGPLSDGILAANKDALMAVLEGDCRAWTVLSDDGPSGDVLVALRVRDGADSLPDPLSLVSLESAGVLVARGQSISSGSRLRLAGGSVCHTDLDLQSRQVHKRVKRSQLAAEDTGLRHRAEFAHMATNWIDIDGPFPRARFGEGVDELVTDFVPGYTLGERLLRGELGAADLQFWIDRVVRVAKTQIWCRETRNQRQAPYVPIVRRRFTLLESDPLFSSLWSGGLLLGSERIPPLRELLVAVEGRWPILQNLPGIGAHGDLILDDIILANTVDSSHVVFVDPNPGNSSWVIDLAKLYMSAVGLYERLYADQFELITWPAGRLLGARYQLPDDDLGGMGASAEAFFASEYEGWCSDLGGFSSVPFAAVRLQAALHMLALPAFHAVHHGKHRRALLFAVRGMEALWRELKSDR